MRKDDHMTTATTTTTTTDTTAELTTLFTSKATDIQSFVLASMVDSEIESFPAPEDVNKIFLSLPKANRDKTTYVLIFTMATLHHKGKLQPILTKAISSVADKDSKSYEKDKAVNKLISLVKSYIALGKDLISILAE